MFLALGGNAKIVEKCMEYVGSMHVGEICKDYVRNICFGVGDLQGMCTEYVGNMYGRYWKGLWVTYWGEGSELRVGAPFPPGNE